MKALRASAPALGFALLALVPLAARFAPEVYALNLASRMLIFALAAMSLEFTLGHAGLISFGQAAYIGIGAYAVAILAGLGFNELLIQLGVAFVAATTFAALTSFISLRAKGIYYVMSTLAFGQMLYFFFVSLSALGGDDGVTLDARARLAGTHGLAGDRAFYYVTLAALFIGYLLLDRVLGSRFGRVLGAIRQNPLRVRALGFDPFGFQLVACVISGCVCSVAGVLLANQNEFVSPAFMSWQRSGDLIVMTALGGVGSLGGAIVGAIGYLLVAEFLSRFTEHTGLLLGPMLVVVALSGRGGRGGLGGAFTRAAGAQT